MLQFVIPQIGQKLMPVLFLLTRLEMCEQSKGCLEKGLSAVVSTGLRISMLLF